MHANRDYLVRNIFMFIYITTNYYFTFFTTNLNTTSSLRRLVLKKNARGTSQVSIY